MSKLHKNPRILNPGSPIRQISEYARDGNLRKSILFTETKLVAFLSNS